MDTTQEELIAALVRRLEGRSPSRRQRRPARPAEDRPELEVVIDLTADDDELEDR